MQFSCFSSCEQYQYDIPPKRPGENRQITPHAEIEHHQHQITIEVGHTFGLTNGAGMWQTRSSFLPST